MTTDTSARVPGLAGVRGSWRALPLAALLLVLAGCAGRQAPGDEAPQAAALPQPADPVASFAAQAQPGAQSSVVMADGQPATLRMGRTYFAASGRECREVLVGAGATQRSQVICQAEGGAWVSARPLLRGGAARP